MKILYILPPQWFPISPHFALPSIIGQFHGTEYNASGIDLNLEFYLSVLEKNHLNKCIKKAQILEKTLAEEIKTFYVKFQDLNLYPVEQRIKLLKYSIIRKFFSEHKKDLYKYPFLISDAINIMRSNEYFYNPKLLIDALNIINTSLKIASLEYGPATLSISNYYNQYLEYNMESFLYYINDKSTNMFIEFFNKKLKRIQNRKADIIGISINSSSQIIPGLTLAKLLKEKTSCHINIGGNYFGRLTDTLLKKPDFFRFFADSVLVEEGELPNIELAEYVNHKRKISDVSNLLYLKNGQVVMNEKKPPMKLDNMKPMSFKGFKLKQYLTPEIVLPFQSSRGCYWHKCSFCDHDFGLHYNIKSIDKLVDEIKIMKKKYNITKFEFIDEAISPAYLKQMSEKFIKEKLNITFFCDGRLEEGFSYEILKNAHDAGLKMILWGLESGSRKIMDLINKGVDFDKRTDVLHKANKAGIFNFAFIFFGFPAETKKDAMETIELITKNSDIIHTYGKSIFTMGKHTKIREMPEKYGVKGEIYQEDEFSPTYKYTASGMTPEELNEMMNLCSQMALKTYGNNIIFKLVSRELIFLYLTKYGNDLVKNYRFD